MEVRTAMNEGRWILVTALGLRVAVNVENVTCVSENKGGKGSRINFNGGTEVDVSESFDEIGAMIR